MYYRNWDPWAWDDLAKAGRRSPKGGGYYTNRETGESRFFRGGQFVPASYEESDGSSLLPLLSEEKGSEAPKPKRKRKTTNESEGSESPKPKRRKRKTTTEGSQLSIDGEGSTPKPKRRRKPAETEGSEAPKPKRKRKTTNESEGSDTPKPKRRRKKRVTEDPTVRSGPPLLPPSYERDIPLLPPPRVPPPLPEDPVPARSAEQMAPWAEEGGENDLAHWDPNQDQ